jgi:Skp family chaperone for outer membrane proteins
MRSIRKSLVVAVACAGLALAPTALFAQGTPAPAPSPAPVPTAKKAAPTVKAKMAYVDVDRAVGETEDGLRAKALLKKKSDREQMRVTAVEDSLRKMQDKLTELAKAGDPAAQAYAIKYQKDLQDYNELIKRINADISVKEDQLFAPIEAKVREIFERIGAEKGIDVIVDKKIIQYVNSAKVEDLTEQVIREYNWGAGPGVAKGATATGTGSPSATTTAATTAPPPPPSASAKPKAVVNPI